VLVGDDSAPVGETLWRAALRGGAQALAQPTGRLAAGMWADFIVLDMDDPALAGQPVERVLDAAIFGPCRRPVRDLVSRGRFVVRDGHHAREQDVLRRYRAALARIDVTSPA
ncbi:MAG: formimidoylglutamate deiminase, partial [Betaproteobacteria bacterium]